jgi:uncharacterized protein YgiM (DUF1202 family)
LYEGQIKEDGNMQRLRKGLLLLIALALILGAVPSRSYATPALEGQYAFVVGTSSLNLRAGPGIQYDVLASAPRGAMVQILSYEGGNWRSVKVLSSDMVGFMDATYLGTAPESLVTPQPVYPIFPIYPTYPPSPSSTQAVVNNPVPTQFLNLRQSPSYTAPVLGIYYNGTICTVLSESGGWYYVEMTGGLRGYFRKNNLLRRQGQPAPGAGLQLPCAGLLLPRKDRDHLFKDRQLLADRCGWPDGFHGQKLPTSH